MSLHRYRIVKALIITSILIVLALPFLLKYKVYDIKKIQFFEVNSSENAKLDEKESTSLYNIVEIIEDNYLFNIESIILENEFKKVILSSNNEITSIKNNLERLMKESIVKDIIEIDYNRNLWIIEVIFN